MHNKSLQPTVILPALINALAGRLSSVVPESLRVSGTTPLSWTSGSSAVLGNIGLSFMTTAIMKLEKSSMLWAESEGQDEREDSTL